MLRSQSKSYVARARVPGLTFGALLVSVIVASCTRLENGPASLANGGSNGSTGGGTSGSMSGGDSGSGSSDMVVDPDASITVQKMACGAATTTDPFDPGTGDLTAVTNQATSAVGSLSTTEQANLMRGTASGCGTSPNYTDYFQSNPTVNQSPVRPIYYRDGPRGVCMMPYSTAPKAPNAAPVGSYSTTFPTASGRGASFDMDLEEKIGAAIGDEMVAVGSTVVLAPVINILRHPAWGRSQETYGEDSYLLGRMGTAFVDGAQQYIPACVKHFAAYNIEQGRQSVSGNVSVMDEQTAYETYGRHFEMVIQDAGVACVMAAYNKIQIGSGQAQFCSQNADLLSTMLRKTFKFQGFVISDWWAMQNGQNCASSDLLEPVAQQGVTAGLDIEMPWSLNYSQLENLASSQTSVPPLIKAAAIRIAAQQFRFNAATPGGPIGLKPSTSTFTPGTKDGDYSVSNASHVQLAYQSALENMVLLKNDKNTLPIPSTVKTVAVVGSSVSYSLQETDINTGTVNFATDVRTGDLGSSRAYPDPSMSTGPFAGISAAAAPKNVTVVSGTDMIPPADFYVVVAGMTPEDEGEGYTNNDGSGGDRINFDLDGKSSLTGVTPKQNAFIQQVIATGKPMVVVLEGGSVINMPWLASVPAVVMAWYPGQDGGHALGDLLFGNANFSGKLPVTWPKQFSDEPTFAGANQTTTMDYYVGYKYFDKHSDTITPLFPFGYGLSYTTFAYSNLQVPCTTVTKDSVVNVQVEVTNTGAVDGDEISMIFVSYPNTTHRRPLKELKAFHRSSIPAGVTKLITIPLRIQDLKYWDDQSHSWQWENGPVTLQVGGSSAAPFPLTGTITIQN